MRAKPTDEETARCPKYLWVLTTLTDDELIGGEEGLPQGLRFHLSQCGACRSLADSILAVTDDLRTLGKTRPDDGLLARADFRANRALEDGARLSGRVDISEPYEPDVGTAKPRRFVKYLPYAAAAAILLAVGLFWARMAEDRPGAVEQEVRPPHVAGEARTSPESDSNAGLIPLQTAPEVLADGIPPDITTEDEVEVPVTVTATAPTRTGVVEPSAKPRSRSYEDLFCDDPPCCQRPFLLGGHGQEVWGSPIAVDKPGPRDSSIDSARLPGND